MFKELPIKSPLEGVSALVDIVGEVAAAAHADFVLGQNEYLDGNVLDGNAFYIAGQLKAKLGEHRQALRELIRFGCDIGKAALIPGEAEKLGIDKGNMRNRLGMAGLVMLSSVGNSLSISSPDRNLNQSQNGLNLPDDQDLNQIPSLTINKTNEIQSLPTDTPTTNEVSVKEIIPIGDHFSFVVWNGRNPVDQADIDLVVETLRQFEAERGHACGNNFAWVGIDSEKNTESGGITSLDFGDPTSFNIVIYTHGLFGHNSTSEVEDATQHEAIHACTDIDDPVVTREVVMKNGDTTKTFYLYSGGSLNITGPVFSNEPIDMQQVFEGLIPLPESAEVYQEMGELPAYCTANSIIEKDDIIQNSLRTGYPASFATLATKLNVDSIRLCNILTNALGTPDALGYTLSQLGLDYPEGQSDFIEALELAQQARIDAADDLGQLSANLFKVSLLTLVVSATHFIISVRKRRN